MSRLEVGGVGAFDVEEGRRLVLAIEEDADVDIFRNVGPRLQEQQRAYVRGRDH